jgi:hypothetical protein
VRVDQGPLERGGEDEQRARETARRLLGRDDPASTRRERPSRPGARRRFGRDDERDRPDGKEDPDGENPAPLDRSATTERSEASERFRRPERAERTERPVPIWRRPERWRRQGAGAGAGTEATDATEVFEATGATEVAGAGTTAQKPRAGRKRGVVRKVDTWSVFKVSLVFYAAMYCIVLVAGVVLWLAATATGLRHNVESFIADLIASGKFHFVGTELLRAAAVAGVVLVVLGTAANVLLVVLYNLISDMVGGLDIVVEDRPAARPRRRTRPRPAREPVDEPAEEPAGKADEVDEADEVEMFKPRPTEASQ